MSDKIDSIIIVGQSGGTNVGESLYRASLSIDKLEAAFVDSYTANSNSQLLNRIYWHLFSKRPFNIKSFSKKILEECQARRPRYLLTTGFSPIYDSVLSEIGKLGIVRINYLTDDPWNPVLKAKWFLDSLVQYDVVFTPRLANIDDIKGLGCKRVEYIPFGYDPKHFYPPDNPDSYNYGDKHECEVLFVGGGDRDRLQTMLPLIESGVHLHLGGSYWERYKLTRKLTVGQMDVDELRFATSRAKINLCLVRKSNRDGHVMRSFEIPAVGGCMLAEYTDEHYSIFGDEGDAVHYFKDAIDMVNKVKWLLQHDDGRKRLAKKSHDLVVNGKNTYLDRLELMLNL